MRRKSLLFLAALVPLAPAPFPAFPEDPAAQEEPAQEPAPDLPSAEELDRAIEKLSQDSRRAGNEEVRGRLQTRLGDLLVLRARVALLSGDEEAARRTYEDALSAAPLHKTGLLELGWLSLRLGRPAQAESLAREGLGAHAEDPEFALLLGEVLYRDGKLDQALPWFERARQASPEDPALKKKLEKLRRELVVEKDHSQRVSPRIALSFDGQRDEAAVQLLESALGDACDDLGRETGIVPREPIPVVLYTKKEFHDTTEAGEEVLGLFDGKVRLPVGGVTRITPGLVRLIRHEMTHALLHSQGLGRIPRWLHEGLAQWFEPRDPAPAHLSSRQAGAENPPDLDPFSYPKSLSFTAFLVQRYSLSRVLWLSAELAKGSPENDAFLRAIGEPREVLIQEWRYWLASSD